MAARVLSIYVVMFVLTARRGGAAITAEWHDCSDNSFCGLGTTYTAAGKQYTKKCVNKGWYSKSKGNLELDVIHLTPDELCRLEGYDGVGEVYRAAELADVSSLKWGKRKLKLNSGFCNAQVIDNHYLKPGKDARGYEQMTWQCVNHVDDNVDCCSFNNIGWIDDCYSRRIDENFWLSCAEIDDKSECKEACGGPLVQNGNFVSSRGSKEGSDACAECCKKVARQDIEDPWKCRTLSPTKQPTAAPTLSPTIVPTMAPSNAPSWSPTEMPSWSPTIVPTVAPSTAQSFSPTEMPSYSPSIAPTLHPSLAPSIAPSLAPSAALYSPAEPSWSPTQMPSYSPTITPTLHPSAAPSTTPTLAPSAGPSAAPSVSPTQCPTAAPPTLPPTKPVKDCKEVKDSKQCSKLKHCVVKTKRKRNKCVTIKCSKLKAPNLCALLPEVCEAHIKLGTFKKCRKKKD